LSASSATTTSEADFGFMDAALSLARRGLGQTWPNPAVGCVIVKNGHVVGRGWTQIGGRPHAETQALNRAGAAAEGDGFRRLLRLGPCQDRGRRWQLRDSRLGVSHMVFSRGRNPSATEILSKIVQSKGLRDRVLITLGLLLLERLGIFIPVPGIDRGALGAEQWIGGPFGDEEIRDRVGHPVLIVHSGSCLLGEFLKHLDQILETPSTLLCEVAHHFR
jgi:hypothetical protein